MRTHCFNFLRKINDEVHTENEKWFMDRTWLKFQLCLSMIIWIGTGTIEIALRVTWNSILTKEKKSVAWNFAKNKWDSIMSDSILVRYIKSIRIYSSCWKYKFHFKTNTFVFLPVFSPEAIWINFVSCNGWIFFSSFLCDSYMND